MKYPEPIVGALILNQNKEVLLIQQTKWNDQYCIPGGHVEIGESIESAIKREVREEVGLNVEIIKLLGVQENINSEYFYKKSKHFIFLDYLCLAKNDDVTVDGREVQNFVWILPENALALNLHEGTRANIKKLLDKS